MKKLIVGLVTVLIFLLAGWSGLWFWTANSLEDQLTTWQSDARAKGVGVNFAGPDWTGYPINLLATFRTPRVEHAKGWSWHGPTVVASASPLSPLRSRWQAPGRHQVTGLPRGSYDFLAQLLRLDIEISPDGTPDKGLL